MAYATQQKQVLRQILERADLPLTAQQVYAEAQLKLPGIGIATVYRALKQFLTKGEARVVEIPGVSPHYESAARTHHHFFVCEKCERLSRLAGCLAGINSLAPKGFRPSRHEIVLYGECEDCTETASASSPSIGRPIMSPGRGMGSR